MSFNIFTNPFKKKRRSAHVYLIRKDRKTLLLKRSSADTWMPGKWGLPGGIIEPGETPRDAAIRETKEETNLDIKNISFYLVREKNSFLFIAREFYGDIMLDHESQDYMWAGFMDIDDHKKYDLVPLLRTELRKLLF